MKWNDIYICPECDRWILILSDDGNYEAIMTDKDDYTFLELNKIRHELPAITAWAYITDPLRCKEDDPSSPNYKWASDVNAKEIYLAGKMDGNINWGMSGMGFDQWLIHYKSKYEK